MKKHYPFMLKKEKNFHILIQKTSKANKSNNSLSNFNIIKINSYINLDKNTKKIFHNQGREKFEHHL